MLKAFIIALLALAGIVVLTHFFAPLLAGVIAVGTGLWVLLVLSIVAFCGVIMAIFVVPFVVIYILGVIAFAWLVLAISASAVMFPILMPLFIVLLFVIFLRKGRAKKIAQAGPPPLDK